MRVVLVTALLINVLSCFGMSESEWWSWSNKQARADSKKTVDQLVRDQGLSYIPLTFKTRDGYVCTMFNIRSLDEPIISNTPLVFFHGILDSSDAWVVNEEQSIPFTAAHAGHDVYLVNNRGNANCRQHIRYRPSQTEFWSFSWDQMAEFDAPDSIDFVLSHTKAKKVVAIAHSQGSTQLFAALTTQPKLKHKISDMIAIAPLAYVSHTTSTILRELAWTNIESIAQGFSKTSGPQEVLPRNELLQFAVPRFCTWWVTSWACSFGMYLITGYSEHEMNYDRMAVFMKHWPSGTSSQNLNHWAQNLRNPTAGVSDFSRFSYETPEQNKAHYNSTKVPAYQLSRFPVDHVRLSLISGTFDPIANPVDVTRLVSDLPSSPSVTHITLPEYDHTTFLWGKNVRRDVSEPVLNYLDQIAAANGTTANIRLRVDIGWSREHGQALAWVGVISATVFMVGVVGVVNNRRNQKQGVRVTRRPGSPKPLLGSDDLAVYHRAPSKLDNDSILV